MEPLPHGRVLYVSTGPTDHGVVRHGIRTALALSNLGLHAECLHAADATGFQGLTGTLAHAAAAGDIVHLDVTDALFGPTPTAAADVLTQLLPPQAAVTLHDIPQPAEGEERFRARAEAYRRIARHVAAVVVSSEHERALLRELTDVPAHVVPLPVEDRRAQVAAAGVVLPPALEGIEKDVVVFGFLYPGKGHRRALDALAELRSQWGDSPLLPRRVTALGPVSTGHAALVPELTRHAQERGLAFRVTGFQPDDVADAALLAAGIPVAAHRNVSSSGSMNSWLSVGRRPAVPAGRYVDEMARLRPGTLRVVPTEGVDLTYALAEAIAEAVEDPCRTWVDRSATLRPGPEDTARALVSVWAKMPALA
ncbi:hypothetical protein [Micrococcus sp.]|uniref:hypothetical protein n=1 Tax=Micrococcus sp. TaxID=1271 RepID=UPI002A91A04B|nr:hypothetical protein [Micrococcus sp.]MDY6054753.1 hypothetical protein [Micrococcus sp.]